MYSRWRLDKTDLLNTLSVWNRFLRKRVHLIACGGTALTLLDVKDSTKDVDFLVPDDAEYVYLIKKLSELGYKKIRGSGWAKGGEDYIFDLFVGKRIFDTELLESPLKEGNNILIKEFSRIYLGVLNCYDLLISKLFRGTGQDMEDCLSLVRAKGRSIDMSFLRDRFMETADYYIPEERVKRDFEYFLKLTRKSLRDNF